MPYIDQASRKAELVSPSGSYGTLEVTDFSGVKSLDDAIEIIQKHVKQYPINKRKGVCNYIVTRIVMGGMEPDEGYGYDTISNAKSVLTDAADELSDRVMRTYEDSCIKRNGDVPEYENIVYKKPKT